MKELPIDKGTRVKLHFALKFEDGETVDSTFDKEPATLEIGDENLPENELTSFYDIAVLKLPHTDEQGEVLLPKLQKHLAETAAAPKIAPDKIKEYKKLFRH